MRSDFQILWPRLKLRTYIPYVAFALTAGLVLAVVSGLFPKPERTTTSIVISPNVLHRTLLSSELVGGRIPANHAISFEMGTKEAKGSVVHLLNKSCGCFELLVDGKKLSIGDQFSLASESPRTLFVQFGRLAGARTRFEQSVFFGNAGQVIPFRVSIEVTPPIAITPNSPIARIDHEGMLAIARFDVVATATDRQKLDKELGVAFEPPVAGGSMRVVQTGEVEPFGSRHFRRTWVVEAKYPNSHLPQSAVSKSVSARVELLENGSDYMLSDVAITVLRSSGLSSPTSLYFGAFSRDVPMARKFVVKSIDGVPFRIQPSVLELPNIHLTSVDKDLPMHLVECHLKVSELGNFRAILSVPTTHPKCPTLEISVSGRVVE